MGIEELRKLNKEQLEDKKRELELTILGSYGKVHPTIKPEQRKNVKREISRINFLLHTK